MEVVEQHDAAGLRNAVRGQVLLENEVMVAALMAQRCKDQHVFALAVPHGR
ncbi:hypothetical protein [Variovorax sp. Varisp62]|uniref:hypothetical protein n=1 Tax=Variovorax sp. Varisp62 TaxID=3243049 RepID=UPI0039B513DD